MRKGNQKFSRCYDQVKARCERKTAPNYYLYGERGIKMTWRSFKDFKEDMYDSFLKHIKEFGEKNTSIDRINVDGHYSKENCRWATWEQQQNNRRNNHKLTYKGKTQSLSRWAREKGLSVQLLKDRINRYKWSTEKALETEKLNPHKKKMFNVDNKEISAEELAKKLGISRAAIFTRIKAGWNMKDITTKTKKINQYK